MLICTYFSKSHGFKKPMSPNSIKYILYTYMLQCSMLVSITFIRKSFNNICLEKYYKSKSRTSPMKYGPNTLNEPYF